MAQHNEGVAWAAVVMAVLLRRNCMQSVLLVAVLTALNRVFG